MLERLFEKRWTETREFSSFRLGLIIPIVAAIASGFVFQAVPNFRGIGTLMFAIILATPTINKLFLKEEKKEVHSKANFFHKHNHIIDSFLYLFVGTFISFLLIGMFFPSLVFTSESLFGPPPQIDTQLPPIPGFEQSLQLQIVSILLNNVVILLVSFLLSIIFGGGSIFLIMLNSSIFASSFLTIAKSTTAQTILQKSLFTLCQLGLLITHGFPEVLAYLIAAVAGGVLSQAFIREKWGSKRFKIVFKDSLILLAIAVAIIAFAAVIEILISKRLYDINACATAGLVWIIAGIVIIKLFVIFEITRQKKKRKRPKRRPKRI